MAAKFAVCPEIGAGLLPVSVVQVNACYKYAVARVKQQFGGYGNGNDRKLCGGFIDEIGLPRVVTFLIVAKCKRTDDSGLADGYGVGISKTVLARQAAVQRVVDGSRSDSRELHGDGLPVKTTTRGKKDSQTVSSRLGSQIMGEHQQPQ